MAKSHALITGGSSGIGLALARLLAGNDANVTIVARDAGRLAAAKQFIESACKGAGQTVTTYSADVRNEGEATQALRSAISALGPPDLFVASAGIVIPGRFEELPPSAFREIMETNYCSLP